MLPVVLVVLLLKTIPDVLDSVHTRAVYKSTYYLIIFNRKVANATTFYVQKVERVRERAGLSDHVVTSHQLSVS